MSCTPQPEDQPIAARREGGDRVEQPGYRAATSHVARRRAHRGRADTRPRSDEWRRHNNRIMLDGFIPRSFSHRLDLNLGCGCHTPNRLGVHGYQP
jgi:hypothetical protein